MLERNRKFGRVSRPTDNEALTTGLTPKKHRRSGRAKHAATSPPKLPGRPRREVPTETAANGPPVIEVDAESQENIRPIEVPAAEPAPEIALPEAVAVEEAIVIEAVSGADPAPPAPDETTPADEPAPLPSGNALEYQTPQIVVAYAVAAAVPIPSIAADERLRPVPRVRTRARKRPVLKWAAAASVAAICVVAFGQFSNAHLSMPSAVALIGPERTAAPASGPVLPLVQIATLATPPADAAILAPIFGTAAHGTDDLIETAALPPAMDEGVTARDATAIPPAAVRAAAPRRPAPKPVAARAAAQRAVASRNAQGESSHGLIPDFLRDLMP